MPATRHLGRPGESCGRSHSSRMKARLGGFARAHNVIHAERCHGAIAGESLVVRRNNAITTRAKAKAAASALMTARALSAEGSIAIATNGHLSTGVSAMA